MLKEKGFSQLMIAVAIGALLILGVGTALLLNIQRTKDLEQEIEALKSKAEQAKLQDQAAAFPDELTPEEIKQLEQELEQEMRFREEFKPEMLMKIEGTESMRTKTFNIDDPRFTANINFFVVLDDFPLPDKPAFKKITLYKVGEPEPVFPDPYGETTSREFLEKHGWRPGVGFPGGMGLNEPSGAIGGFRSGGISIGTGEFYFEIEVENIDRWVLTVEKVLAM